MSGLLRKLGQRRQALTGLAPGQALQPAAARPPKPAELLDNLDSVVQAALSGPSAPSGEEDDVAEDAQLLVVEDGGDSAGACPANSLSQEVQPCEGTGATPT